MKMVSPISSLTYDIVLSSTEVLTKINMNKLNVENPLLNRKLGLGLPLHELAIGRSIMINQDRADRRGVIAVRMGIVRINKEFNDMFYVIKHRGDKRTSGFKYLEIGRIK